MDLAEKLKQLKNKQQKLLKEYDDTIQETESSIILTENEKLKKQLIKHNEFLKKLKEEHHNLLNENQNLKLSLNEQIIDEKLKIIKISQNRLDLFFKKEKLQNTDRLTYFEQKIKKQITVLKNEIENNIHDEQETFLKEIENLNLKISEKLKKQREELITEENKLYAYTKKGLNSFSKEKVDEKIIQKRIRQNKIEMKIGLSWINKIGIFLILLGVGFAAYYNREYIDDYLKGAFYFLLGIAFLIGGEILYRRKNDVFAKGLLGGGIAILYGFIFISCFMLNIISLNIGFLVAFIITSTAIILSLRYNSKTIISFGLIGGYLPFFIFQGTTGFQGEMFYFGMGYLFILNLLVLLISFQKQWTISNFISFIFNIPCIIYLVFNCPNEIVGIFYSILVFGMYFIVILGYPFIKKTSLKAFDIMLIAFNTIISTIIIYLLLEKAELFYLRGYLALGFCLFYFGLARFLNKVMHQEKGTIVLFYLTALTFAVLMIPFQFGAQWVTLGWLIEGTLLVVYGHKKDIKPMETAGRIIFSLCLGVFILFDVLGMTDSRVEVKYFDLKFLFITVGLIITSTVYQIDMNKNKFSELSKKGQLTKNLTYFSIIVLYIFSLFNGIKYYNKWIVKPDLLPLYLSVFYRFVLVAIISFGLGYILSKMKAVFDRVVRTYYYILCIIGDLICVYILLFLPVFSHNIYGFITLKYLSVSILIIYNIFVLFNIRSLLIKYLKYKNKNYEYYPLIMGIILMANITSLMVVQFNLDHLNLLLSFAYLALAVTYIIYGFKRRFLFIRYFGLGLTIFALAKLFFWDLRSLEESGRIIAYFGFGFILLIISYIYQLINKKINKEINEKV